MVSMILLRALHTTAFRPPNFKLLSASSSFSTATVSTAFSHAACVPGAKRTKALTSAAPPVRQFSAEEKPSGGESSPAKDDSKKEIPDRVEMATGLEKKQLLALLHGDDRYEPKIYAPAPGTKEEPNIVPVTGETRLVGCICEPDQHYINYMTINLGEMKRCECGYWFKSVKGDPDIF